MGELKFSVKVVGLLVLCSLIAACTAQHTADRSAAIYDATGISGKTRIQRNEQWVMQANSRIYLAHPRTGKKSQEVQQQLSKNLARSLEQNFAEIVMGSSALPLSEALREAKANGMAYLFYPRLAAVRDGINSVQEVDDSFFEDDKSFGFDRLSVQVQIYNAQNGQFMDRVNIESRSGWFSIYSNSPEELMASAFEKTSKILAGQIK